MLNYNKSQTLPGFAKESAPFAPFINHDGDLFHPSDVSIRTKKINVWDGYNRIQPMTAVSQGLLSSQEVNFQLGSNLSTGYLDELHVQITILEGNVGTWSINPYNLFNRIDVQDIAGSVFHQYFPDELFLSQALYRDRDEVEKVNSFEKLNANFTPMVNPQNASYTYTIAFPLFHKKMIDLRHLRSPLMLRFYLNSAANIAFTGSSTNLQLVSINLLTKEIPLPCVTYNKPLHFKYHNWVRNVENIQLQPSNDYNIKLNTFSGHSKFMFVILRRAPTQTNANNLFDFSLCEKILNFQLNDSTGNIIGIAQNPLENKHITAVRDFNSVFLRDNATNIIFLNFSLSSSSHEGVYSGGFDFSTNEFFKFTTRNDLIAGNYELTFWSVNHEIFKIHPNGDFTYSK